MNDIEISNEEPEYISLKAAAAGLGIKYSTFRERAIKMGIPFKRFPHDHRRYLPFSAVKRIKEEQEAYNSRVATTL